LEGESTSSPAATTERNENGRGTEMQVRVLGFSRSLKPAVLAAARLELNLGDGDSIIVDDARVLRNKHGELWLAMPSYSVPANGGRSYEYLPAIVLSKKLKRDVDDSVLAAFTEWQYEQQPGVRP
jgi:DNA-binding cell septation regulator SpoVG